MNPLSTDYSLSDWQVWPMWRPLLFFIAGIFLGKHFEASLLLSSFFAITMIFTALYLHDTKYFLSVRFASIFIFLSFLGLGMISIALTTPDNGTSHFSKFLSDQPHNHIGYICQVPSKKKTTSAVLNITYTDGHPSYGKLLVYFDKNDKTTFYRGDIISIHSKIFPTKPNPNPKTFDYSNYLKSNNIYHQIFLNKDKYRRIGHQKINPIVLFAQNIRHKTLEIFRQKLTSPEHVAVASAMILGYKDLLSRNLKNTFAETGSAHILAVSGLHLGIVLMFFSMILRWMKTKTFKQKIIKFFILTSLIWLYALVTGASSAVLRAAIMFTFFLFAKYFEETSNIYNLLATSALLLLLYNPNYLFQPGFQFSYLALFSIVYFQPIITNWYQPKTKIKYKIWSLVTVSLAAQIMIFPVSVYYFHKFPTYFILSGVISVFLAFFVLSLGMIFLVFSWVPLISDILTFLFDTLLSIFIASIRMIKSLPFHYVDNIWFSSSTVLLLYLIIFAYIFFRSIPYFDFLDMNHPLSKKRLLAFSIIALSIFGLTFNHLYYAWRSKTNSEMIIYNSPNGSLIDIFEGDCVYTYSNIKDKSKKSFINDGNQIYHGVQSKKVLTFDTDFFSSIFAIDSRGIINFKDTLLWFLHCFSDENPFRSDIVVLTDSVDIYPYKILANHTTGIVVIDASIPRKVMYSWRTECKKHNIPTHIIPHDGVFVLK